MSIAFLRQKSICLLSSVQNVLLAQAEEKEKAQNKERKKMSSCGIRKVGKWAVQEC